MFSFLQWRERERERKGGCVFSVCLGGYIQWLWSSNHEDQDHQGMYRCTDVCLENTVSSLRKHFSLLNRSMEISWVPWSNSTKTRVLLFSFPLCSISSWLLKINSSPKLQYLSNFHLSFNWKWGRLEGFVCWVILTVSTMKPKISDNKQLWCLGQRHLNNGSVNWGCYTIVFVSNTLYVAEMVCQQRW